MANSNVPINIKNLTVWVMESENSTDGATYGTTYSLADRFMTFTDTPAQKTAEQYGDGIKQREYVGKSGGELSLGINFLTQEEKADIYGETVTGKVSAMGENDIVPYCCVAFKVENDDGTIDLRKYPKIKLVEQATTITQKDGNGVTYANDNLKGNYLFALKEKEARYVAEDLDETTNATEIESWFTEATFNTIPAK